MMDVAEQQGIRVEAHVLEAALGLPVVPMVASRDQGVQELLQAVEDVARHRCVYAPRRPEIRQDHAGVLGMLRQIIADHTPEPYPPDWVALKLLEGDEQITSLVRKNLDEADWTGCTRSSENMKTPSWRLQADGTSGSSGWYARR